MPFPSHLADPRLIAELNAFAHAKSFPDLYRAYSWKNDTCPNGFPDIYELESKLIHSDRTTGITLDDVKAVAAWGAMRNQRRINGPALVASGNTLHTPAGPAVPALETQPLTPLATIGAHLHGIGPTYLSKVLRFTLPQEYGAIDTRCVRVFGRGDADAHQHNWIDLRARDDGYGWYIPRRQARWPDAYVVWTNILRHFAAVLSRNCPHPPAFVQSGLRQRGTWECADVEMALFSYASNHT